MMIATEDYTTWITEKTNDYVIYENTEGKRWKVSGTCNQCGMCETYENYPLNQPIEQKNYRKNQDGDIEEYTRILIWHHLPGTPGAVEEVNHHLRKDVPMGPNATEKIEQCSLVSEWL
jgi:hypothetical protein